MFLQNLSMFYKICHKTLCIKVDIHLQNYQVHMLKLGFIHVQSKFNLKQAQTSRCQIRTASCSFELVHVLINPKGTKTWSYGVKCS
jgi:hypothetical protein